MELTNVKELIKMLEQFPPETKVFVGGLTGYLHTTENANGDTVIVFDDCSEI